MIRLHSIKFVTVLATLAFLLIAGAAIAAPKVMKIGLASPPKDWAYNYSPHRIFKEIVEAGTHGSVKVELYPSNQLGGAKVSHADGFMETRQQSHNLGLEQ